MLLEVPLEVVDPIERLEEVVVEGGGGRAERVAVPLPVALLVVLVVSATGGTNPGNADMGSFQCVFFLLCCCCCRCCCRVSKEMDERQISLRFLALL